MTSTAYYAHRTSLQEFKRHAGPNWKASFEFVCSI